VAKYIFTSFTSYRALFCTRSHSTAFCFLSETIKAKGGPACAKTGFVFGCTVRALSTVAKAERWPPYLCHGKTVSVLGRPHHVLMLRGKIRSVPVLHICVNFGKMWFLTNPKFGRGAETLVNNPQFLKSTFSDQGVLDKHSLTHTLCTPLLTHTHTHVGSGRSRLACWPVQGVLPVSFTASALPVAPPACPTIAPCLIACLLACVCVRVARFRFGLFCVFRFALETLSRATTHSPPLCSYARGPTPPVSLPRVCVTDS
jgi:hypothetical protein